MVDTDRRRGPGENRSLAAATPWTQSLLANLPAVSQPFESATWSGQGCMDDCASHSWKNYINDSAITSVIISTGLNMTQVACAAHARGARALITSFGAHRFNTSRLEDSAYTNAWVSEGVKHMRETTPWADGVNLDLEHFPKTDNEKGDLVTMVCELHRQLKAAGLSLHSQDLAPWGSWGVFNVTALAQCVDYVVPMAYCSPTSGTIAGPTDPLDNVKNQIQKGWRGVDPSKFIIGLPFFGYNFACTNSQPPGFPYDNTCFIAQPPRYPFVTFAQAMELFKKENVSSGAGVIHYNSSKAAAWFEFTNASSGARHQVWFDDHRSVAAKSAWVFGSGFHGLSFWTADSLYDGLGDDTAAARAMWRAAAPKGLQDSESE